ncbi:hypothetical protein [uncultured Bacteroides sp.]|uniref:hypothetical protein n=1 Tax=uncultured Bacteroides sp. TaxID=162156 RepID=UPI002590F4F8|nr:hypothetical protein [uncultured Bacteroides sp.]
MIYISKAGLAVVNTSLRSKNKRYSLRLQQCKAEIVPESGSQRRKVTRASSTGFSNRLPVIMQLRAKNKIRL